MISNAIFNLKLKRDIFLNFSFFCVPKAVNVSYETLTAFGTQMNRL